MKIGKMFDLFYSADILWAACCRKFNDWLKSSMALLSRPVFKLNPLLLQKQQNELTFKVYIYIYILFYTKGMFWWFFFFWLISIFPSNPTWKGFLIFSAFKFFFPCPQAMINLLNTLYNCSLMRSMEETYSRASPAVVSWKPGNYCAAKRADDKWYRGRIEKAISQSKMEVWFRFVYSWLRHF